jgi:hypothetical protein
VTAVAAEHSLPYACVPAGTRNHFALDLGVDRDDVVDALDALVDGAERIVDLAEVNGRVFVNNVSLGVYGEAVKRPQYRNAKLRTLLATVPDAVAPDRQGEPLRWTDPEGSSSRVRKVACKSWSRTTATGWATLRNRECGRTLRRGCSASSLSASEPLHQPTARCRAGNGVSRQPGRSPWRRAGVSRRASTARPSSWSRR